MNLLKKAWQLMGGFYVENDSYINTQGKGFLQRYVESIADEIFDNEYQFINYFVENVAAYETLVSVLLPLQEKSIGFPSKLSNTESVRRKLLSFKSTIDNLAGSEIAFEIIYRAMGFKVLDNFVETGIDLGDNVYYYVDGDPTGGVGTTVREIETGLYFFSDSGETITGVSNAYLKRQTIEELPYNAGTLDDPIRVFDSGDRTFDSSSKTCGFFNIRLYGDLEITASLIRYVYLAARYIKPINADLLYIYYNGVLLLDWIIEVYINEEGDLVFNNDPDPNLMLSIVDGDLYVRGTRASFYAKSINGDLIYDDGL
jgi:hypothetical protein